MGLANIFVDKKILSLFFFLILSDLFGQNRPHSNDFSYIQKLSLKDGLSQVDVSTIIKDKDGFVWIGTDDGLNRFDGNSFLIYRHVEGDSTSLNDNKIIALLEDSRSRLWVGTNQGGLHLYNKEQNAFQKFYHDPDDANTLSYNTIRGLREDGNNNLWIATNYGLNTMDLDGKTVKRFYREKDGSGLANNHINAIEIDTESNIWVGTIKGLSVVNGKTHTIKSYYHDLKDESSLAHNHILSIFSDSDGDIWIGSDAGINLYDKKSDSFIGFWNHEGAPDRSTHNGIRRIREIKKGTLWFGTDGAGIFSFNKESQKFHKIKIRNNTELDNSVIYEMAPIDDRNIWIGLYENGIRILSKKQKEFIHIEYFNPHMEKSGKNTVRSIQEDDEQNIWIGTDGSGLYKYNPRNQKFIHYLHDPKNLNSISGDVIKTLLKDSKGNIYAGTYIAGLNYIDTKSNKITRFYSDDAPNTLSNNTIWALSEDKEGIIWIGTLGGGLNEYDPLSGLFTSYTHDQNDSTSISANRISKIIEDSKGNLWIGTIDGGICRLIRENRTFKNYHKPIDPITGINYNEVIDILEDQKGDLWITTNGGGLYKYNQDNDSFDKADHHEVLKSTILSILDDDDGNLWMGTHYGIGKYNPIEGNALYFNTYDGVQGMEFKSNSKYKSSTGEFYLGGTNGLNIFRPEEIVEDTSTYPIILTNFYLFHKKINVADNTNILQTDIQYQNDIRLTSGQNTLTFEYAVLDYNLPRNNNYAYILEGFDEDWNYVKDEYKATYTRIPPGNYVFKVKGSNNEGYWNENPKTVNIYITPPYWQTWWFKILSGILVVGIGYFFFNYRILKLTKINMDLEKKVSDRTLRLNKLVGQLQEKQDEIETTNVELTATLDEVYGQKNHIEVINKELQATYDKLKTSNSELDKRVHDRTSKLLKSNQELDRFVYSASHDLSAPLKSILGLINIAKHEEKSKFNSEHLLRMRNSVKKLENVIKSLTQFSRNAGHKIIKESFIFNDLIDEVLEELKYSYETDRTRLLRHYSESDKIKCDYLRIKIIISNLLSNAFKYQDEFKNDSFVDISLIKKKKNYVILIKDNGIGILKENKSKIFDMFFRGTTKSDGSGLGLYIVKETLEKLNGKIKVQSRQGEATAFLVKIPA